MPATTCWQLQGLKSALKHWLTTYLVLVLMYTVLMLLTTICTGGSPFSMLSGASSGEQKGSLTTGEVCILISASCSERSGSNPSGNSLPPSCDPSSPAGGGMATEDRSLAMGGSASLERKKLTSSGYIKEEMGNYSGEARQQWSREQGRRLYQWNKKKDIKYLTVKLGCMYTYNTLSLWKSKNLGSVPERLDWTIPISKRKSIFKILRHLCLLFFPKPATNPACLCENTCEDNLQYLASTCTIKKFWYSVSIL